MQQSVLGLRCSMPSSQPGSRLFGGCHRKLHSQQTAATRSPTKCQSSKLQTLYEQAVATFGKGQQPQSPSDMTAVREALSSIPLEELGLQQHQNPAVQKQGKGMFGRWKGPSRAPPITYTPIHEDDIVSIGIFSLPAKTSLPLHNHPGMVVLSRVLYGQMHVKSFDWVDPNRSSNSQKASSSAANLILDEVVERHDQPAVIFPSSGGNIHQFTAVTDCAVLDVLAPPYSPEGGRDCTYYEVVGDEHGNQAQLVESSPEPAINMRNIQYKGVRIKAAVSSR